MFSTIKYSIFISFALALLMVEAKLAQASMKQTSLDAPLAQTQPNADTENDVQDTDIEDPADNDTEDVDNESDTDADTDVDNDVDTDVESEDAEEEADNAVSAGGTLIGTSGGNTEGQSHRGLLTGSTTASNVWLAFALTGLLISVVLVAVFVIKKRKQIMNLTVFDSE
eukprot:XP_011669166.1 PREDICTED: uncharacterized protein LOC105440561 [Strongylocentrotus purpuratus]